MTIVQSLALLLLVILVEAMLYNIVWRNPPKLPGDIYFDKSRINVYIPFTSAIVITVLLTLLINFFGAKFTL